MIARLSHAQRLAILTLVGFLLRLAAGLRAAVIARDGAAYLDQAARLLGGAGEELLRNQYPPGYPLWVALWSVASGRVDEATGALASAIAGALVVPAIGILATRAAGARAGLFAALLAAVLPQHVLLGGEVLSDALHLALLAWTLVGVQHLLEDGRLPLLTALGVALVGLAAYLTRPEAIVVLGVAWLALLGVRRPETPWRARARDAGWFLAVAALLLIPVLIAFATRETPTGSGAGAFKLTLKQDMWGILAARTLGDYVANIAGLVGEWLKALAVGVPLLAVAIVGRDRARPETRRLAWLCGAAGLALLLAFAVIRVDRRHAAQLALLAVPLAGWGVALLAKNPQRTRALIAVILLASLPFGLKTLHRKKATYRAAGQYLKSHGIRYVLARDSRVGFYAGGVTTKAFVELTADARAPTLGDLTRRLSETGTPPPAIVLPIERPSDAALSNRLAAYLERPPHRIRQEGAVALDVFLVRSEAR